MSTESSVEQGVNVICAWPLSAQYGPGVRWLYYSIIVGCLVLPKAAWLRNFCLASALLIPAVTASHAITLASVHINGAVDLNIYGAFQFCALGILSLPFTVKVSSTYLRISSHRIMLCWTCLNFAGLLCLTVEFCRSNPVPCLELGNNVSAEKFQYGNTTCGLKCNNFPTVSPLRNSPAETTYVVPSPSTITFGTATLLSSACGVLSAIVLISSWNKLLRIDWKGKFGGPDVLTAHDNTKNPIFNINSSTRLFLTAFELPIWMSLALVIIILGEINLLGPQMRFQTEKMTAFGQWSPLAGAAIAITGTIYMLTSWKSEDNGALATKLIYHPLEASQFRLFEPLPTFTEDGPIVGRLHVVDINSPPRYTALSYVWGQEPEIHRIEINRQNVRIRPNIFQALQRLSARMKDDPRQSPRYLWIDSLCINQQDLDEKNIQVRQMANIYQKAQSVFIWLGEEDFASTTAMDFIRKIIAKKFSWDPQTKWWEAYELTALSQLLGRPWFRRRWIIQEAAFSAHSVIFCGSQDIPLEYLVRTASQLRLWLNTASITDGNLRKRVSANDMYPELYDSPATRIFQLITDVFERSIHPPKRQLTLETLVDLSTFCEASNPRDTIYALLSLAKEQDVLSCLQPTYSLIPDYKLDLRDIFTAYVLHCVDYSGSLDIICRPWAPGSASRTILSDQSSPTDKDFLSNLPSWIATKDLLPFGNPSLGLTQRVHGRCLVGKPFPTNRVYNAHNDTKPEVTAGQLSIGLRLAYTGALFVKGINFGTISRVSVRMANAIIPVESLEILGIHNKNTVTHSDNWRILCADRDNDGNKSVPWEQSTDKVPNYQMPESDPSRASIDVEELLQEDDISADAREYFDVMRNVVWNRRAFEGFHRLTAKDAKAIIGLAPPGARERDSICILYGCSTPLILRELYVHGEADCSWRLIGEAYVHDFMDGEAIKSLSPGELPVVETLFVVR